MNITRAGAGLLASGIIAIALGRFFGILELFLLTAMVLTAFIFALFFVLTSYPKIEIARKSRPGKLRANSNGEIILSLKNNGQRYTSVLQAVDSINDKPNAKITIASLPPRNAIKMSYTPPALKRGTLTVGPMKISNQDPLGLLKKFVKTDSTSTFLVRPELITLPPITAKQGKARITSRTIRSSRRGDEDFYALRPYVLGDDLRKVHWRAAAKSDELLVRQERKVELGAVVIVLDTSAGGYQRDHFEQAIKTTCSVLHSAYNGGDLIKFYTTSSPKPHIIDSLDSLEQAEKNLALLKPDPQANITGTLQALTTRSVGGALISIFGDPTKELAIATQKCQTSYKQIIPISCSDVQTSSWALLYNGNNSLLSLWTKALTVPAK